MQRVARTTRPLSFASEGTPTVVLESRSTAWAALPFEIHRTIPGELNDAGPPAGEVALVVFMRGTVEMAGVRAGRDFRYRATPGTTVFMSGQSP